MRPDVRRLILAGASLVLVCGAGYLAACSGAHREALAKAEADARAKVNQYCDARQKIIEALGADDAGAP